MTRGKPLRLREPAERDLLSAFEHYVKDAPQVASHFIDAFEQARSCLERRPAIGSPRYAEPLQMPGLRSWALTGFPYLLFYVERAEYLEGIRLLHQRADIPAWLQDEGSAP